MNIKRILLLAFGCMIALPAFTQTKFGTLKTYKDSLTFKTVPSKIKSANGTTSIRTDTITVFVSPTGKVKTGVVTWRTDSIPIPPTPIDTGTYYADDASAVYAGKWTHHANDARMHNGTYSFGNELNATITESFNGTALKWYASKYPTHGIALLKIDQLPAVRVDLYSQIAKAGILVYATTTPLTAGMHTVTIKVTGEKNTASSNTWVEHDAFRITGEKPIPPEPPTVAGQWYVDDDSNANGDGSKGNPFNTISKAAAVAHQFDTVVVQAGTYRETITPAANGIVFIGQGATISGLNKITSAWTVHSGNIYKTPLANGPMFTELMTGFNNERFDYNNDQLLAQQLFKDGEMQFLAQYPKVSTPEGMLERETMRGRNHTSSFNQTSINDAPLDDYGNLVGAYVWVNGWFLTYTRPITSHSGTTIGFNTTDVDMQFSKFYRVFGKLNLLTQAKEWFYDGAYFYFWQSGGGSPTNVEFKKRNWGFDLRGKSNTTIAGFNFIGCEPITTNSASVNTIVNNIRAKYNNHTVLETKGGADGYHDSAVQTGMKLLGAGSKILNSEFTYMAGMGVWMGSNTEVRNNKFTDTDYNGQYSAPIKPIWGAGNLKILNNTFTRCGRGGIEFTPENGATNLNIEIGYNNFSLFNMLNVDGGAIYSSRKLDMTGLHIHHNWFHNDGGYDEAGTGKQAGIQVNGIYFDQAAGPATIDHNVFWNGMNDGADIYNDLDYEGRICPVSLIYNNTMASVNSGTAFSYATYDTHPNDVQRNNIYRMDILVNWGASPGNVANSLRYTSNPQFVGGSLSTPQTYFQIQSGSPARGIATAIAGINDGDTSPKDAGAYYYGQSGWVAGYNNNATPQSAPFNYLPFAIALIIFLLIVIIILYFIRKRRR